jgi:septal ring factor EnvC (AmiA/AmiB activator)
MSAVLIVIIVAAVVLLFAAFLYLRHAQAERVIEDKRLEDEVGVYRRQASVNVSRARELGREADEQRRLAQEHAELSDRHATTAAEHAERAAELEGGVSSAGEAAARHEAAAAERERQRS